jgi:hypothetical protein
MKLKARMNLPCLWRIEDLRNRLDRFFAFAWCALCRLRSISAYSSSSSNRYPPLLKCFLWFRNSKSEEMMSILQNAISTWREGKIIKPVRRYCFISVLEGWDESKWCAWNGAVSDRHLLYICIFVRVSREEFIKFSSFFKIALKRLFQS